MNKECVNRLEREIEAKLDLIEAQNEKTQETLFLGASTGEDVRELETLCKLRLEIADAEEKSKYRKLQFVTDTLISGASILLPLAFYNMWVNMGYKFEETGIHSSQTLKDMVFRQLRPKLK